MKRCQNSNRRACACNASNSSQIYVCLQPEGQAFCCSAATLLSSSLTSNGDRSEESVWQNFLQPHTHKSYFLIPYFSYFSLCFLPYNLLNQFPILGPYHRILGEISETENIILKKINTDFVFPLHPSLICLAFTSFFFSPF